ncbi:MAG: hypothetical protein M0P13_04330 [Fibrobacteraceae bacterium]|nr:hypothetical protein [Fibrobacteraceae bacterium]
MFLFFFVKILSAASLCARPCRSDFSLFQLGKKSYRCNPDRGSDCGDDWVRIYGLNASNAAVGMNRLMAVASLKSR